MGPANGPTNWPAIGKALGLLICSNAFMTYAWYGHLKDRSRPLIAAILLSWGVAFFEYCLQVPGNRIGSYALSVAQLKVLQEAIALAVFALFSIFYLQQGLTRYDWLAFGLSLAAVAVSVLQPS